MSTSQQLPHTIGGMEILAILSSGGMGQVLLARRRGALGFEKLVAVKTMRVDLAGRDDMRKMFVDEARLLSQLDHPSVAHVFDFGEERGVLYLAMEHVAGVTFRELIAAHHTALSIPTIALLMEQVCQGLQAAHDLTDLAGHSLGVVHRDISPSNLMLTFDARVKILDFGIALMRRRMAPVTRLGVIKGKPRYMAPEQLTGGRIDRRTDIYAACRVLQELVIGPGAFRTDTSDVPTLDDSTERLPSTFRGLVRHGLQCNVESRFSSAREMANELRAIAAPYGGQELVERFVEAELGSKHQQHREKLARLLGGGRDSPSEGRTTATLHTAVGPSSNVNTSIRELSTEKTTRPMNVAAAFATQTGEVPARWGIGALFAALAVVAVVGGGVLLNLRGATSEHPASPIVAERAAPVSALIAVEADGRVAQDPDAAVSASTVVEASTARSGPRPRAVFRRTNKRRRVASRSQRKPRRLGRFADAGGQQPRGVGHLTVGSREYAEIVIDGQRKGPGPLIRYALPAGKHTVELLAPLTGKELLRRVVYLRPGDQLYITHP